MNYYLAALRNYATFSGRARRSEYWYFFLFNIIAMIGFTILSKMLGLEALVVIYQLAVLIPGLAVGVRRCMMLIKVAGSF